MSRTLPGKSDWKNIPVKDPEAKSQSCLETEESQGSWEIVSKGEVAENEVEYSAGSCQNLIR